MDEPNIEALCRRWFQEVWVEGRVETVDELIHPDCESDDLDQPGGVSRGIQPLKDAQQLVVSALSGRHVEIGDVIVQGNRAAVRFRLSGRHTGKLWGIPPKGIQLAFNGMTFFEFDGGQVRRAWNTWDRFGLFSQLGPIRLG